MSRETRFQVLEVSEMDCRTTLKSTGLVKRAVTASCLAVSVRKMQSHCAVRVPAFMIAASRVAWKRKEGLQYWWREEKRREDKRATEAWA